MRIAFVLPTIARRPAGGFRVVYTYANKLATLGHHVSIVHLDIGQSKPRRGILRRAVYYKVFTHSRPRWIDLDARIRTVNSTDLGSLRLTRPDVVVATGVKTAIPVAQAATLLSARAFYFVQHFEDFIVPEDDVVRSFSLPLRKIVVSAWLQRRLADLGYESDLVLNGVDTDFFHPPETESRPYCVLSMLSDQPWKRTDLLLDMYRRLVEKHPRRPLAAFGVVQRPSGLPDEVDYFRDPSQDQLARLYRSAEIFVCASDSEGFGLPVLEAMSSGCAVVSTDIAAVRSFAGDVPIFVERGNGTAIFECVAALLEAKRNAELGLAGRELALKMSIEGAASQFAGLMTSPW